jgi:hypothetical protein
MLRVGIHMGCYAALHNTGSAKYCTAQRGWVVLGYSSGQALGHLHFGLDDAVVPRQWSQFF